MYLVQCPEFNSTLFEALSLQLGFPRVRRRYVVLYPLAALDGGPGGSEGSPDFDEATEPSTWVFCPFCTW